MLSLLKLLIGGISYNSNPVATGVKHLQQGIKGAGLPISNYPPELLNELSNYSYKFSQNLAKLSSREKPVTYFVNNLEVTITTLYQSANGETPEVPQPVHEILARYGIRSKSLS